MKNRSFSSLSLIIFAACNFLLCACDALVLPIEDRHAWNKLNNDIMQNNWEAAKRFSEEMLAKSGDNKNKIISQLNLALCSLHNHDCTQAQNILLNALNEDVKTSHLSNEQRASFHYILSRAFVCTADSLSKAQNNPPEPSHQADRFYNEALDHLEKASELGMDVGHSFEELYRHIYPPCTQFQTAQIAAANSPESALALPALPPTPSVLCAESPVYLLVEPLVGDRFSVALELSPLNRTQWLDHSSQLPYAQVRAELVRIKEQEEVLTSVSQPPPDSLLESTQTTFLLELPTWVAHSPEPVYLKLTAQKHGESQFVLKDRTVAACERLEDAHEPNDSLDAARFLFEGTVKARKCPQNEDWFQFVVEPKDTAWFKLQSEEEDGFEIGYEILDQDQRVIAQKEPEKRLFDEPYVIVFENTSTQKQFYHFHILAGEEVETSYALTYKTFPPCPADADAAAPNYDMDHPFYVYPPLPDPNQPDVPPKRLLEPLRLCPNQTEFFRFSYTLPDQTEEAKIKVMFGPSVPDKSLTTLFWHEENPIILESKAHNSEKKDNVREVSFTPKSGMPTLELSSDVPMVYGLEFSTGVQKQNENASDKNKQKNDNNPENKEQDSESNNEENQDNSAPQNPTQQPQNPQEGSQNQGDHNQPDPSENKNKSASQSDPDAQKKERVEDMLNSIEEADKNLPLSKFSKYKRRNPVKNW